MTSANDKGPSKWAELFIQGVSEGLAIAVLTTFAYIIAFSYEVGYLSHFGVPKSLIGLTPRNIFTAFGSMTMIFVLSIIIADLFLARSKSRRTALALKYFLLAESIALSSTALLASAVISGWRLQGILLNLLAIATIAIFLCINIWYSSFVDDQADALIDTWQIYRILIWHAALIVLSAYTLGRAYAAGKIEFPIVDSATRVAILSIYGDRAIGIQFDPGSKTCYPNYIMYSMDASDGNSLFAGPDPRPIFVEKVGPLKLQSAAGTLKP